MRQSIWAAPDLRGEGRGCAKQGRAVAATHHLPRRTLHTFHGWDGSLCRCGWQQRQEQQDEGGDRLHHQRLRISIQ